MNHIINYNCGHDFYLLYELFNKIAICIYNYHYLKMNIQFLPILDLCTSTIDTLDYFLYKRIVTTCINLQKLVNN